MDYFSLEECVSDRCAEVDAVEPGKREAVFLEFPTIERKAVAIALQNVDWLRRHCGFASVKSAEESIPSDWRRAALAVCMKRK
jgi:hypothetical protein